MALRSSTAWQAKLDGFESRKGIPSYRANLMELLLSNALLTMLFTLAMVRIARNGIMNYDDM